MTLGQMVDLLRRRARSADPGLDETILRSVNLASDEVGILRPWWFLRDTVTVTTGSDGKVWLPYRLAYPLEDGGGVVWDSTGKRLVQTKREDASLVTGTEPQVWWARYDLGSRSSQLSVAPPGVYQLYVEAYWLPDPFPVTGWDPQSTNALLSHVPGLILARAWVEVSYWLGRAGLEDSYRAWAGSVEMLLGSAPEQARR